MINNRKSVDNLVNGDWFKLSGQHKVEHWTPSLFYPKKKVLANIYDVLNGITNEGKNLILNVQFNDVTAIANASWFIGLIDNSGFSSLAAADVMNSHAGWAEFVTYSESTRVAWGSGTATSQSTTNASPATFDITGTATVYGIFVTSNGTKSGTTGKLWSTASFTSPVPVGSGDQLKCSYSVSC